MRALIGCLITLAPAADLPAGTDVTLVLGADVNGDNREDEVTANDAPPALALGDSTAALGSGSGGMTEPMDVVVLNAHPGARDADRAELAALRDRIGRTPSAPAAAPPR